MRISIILATYNERENLGLLLEKISMAFRQFPSEWEVIVVDDASPDGTGEFAETLSANYPVRVLHRAGKMGLASAVVAGFQLATGETRVVMDADLSHDAAILPQLVNAIEAGAELAIGSRFVPGGGIQGWPRWRQLMSRAATHMAFLLFRLRVRDPMSGYFAVSQVFFHRVAASLNPRGYKILLEMIVRGRPNPIREIGFVFRDRQFGKSKVTMNILGAYLRMLWDLTFRRR